MITSEVIDKLKEFLNDDEIRVDELLSKHTTYKIGGKADIFVMPSSNEKVRDCIKLAKENNIDFYILGRGSNVLASDDGFRGIVINLADKFSSHFVFFRQLYSVLPYSCYIYFFIYAFKF